MPQETLNEKVSVNINSSTLSAIDLLVDNGYYSNRSDFINQALRRELDQQQRTIDRIIDQQQRTATRNDHWFIGLYGLEDGYIRELHEQGQQITLQGYGVLSISANVDPAMLYQVVTSITIRGRTVAPAEIKQHYGLK